MAESSESAESDPVTTIHISGFPEDIKQRELLNLVRFLPDFEGSSLNHSKRGGVIGFARFHTHEAAVDAMDKINGDLYFDEDDPVARPLRACLARRNMILKPKVKRSRNQPYPYPPRALQAVDPAWAGGYNNGSGPHGGNGYPAPYDRGESRGRQMDYLNHPAKRTRADWGDPAVPGGGNTGGYAPVYASQPYAYPPPQTQQQPQPYPRQEQGHGHGQYEGAPAYQGVGGGGGGGGQPYGGPHGGPPYAPGPNRGSGPGVIRPCDTLCIRNLDPRTTEEDVGTLVRSLDGFLQTRFIPGRREGDRSMAFVKFSAVPQATAALGQLQGARLSFSEHELAVQYAFRSTK